MRLSFESLCVSQKEVNPFFVAEIADYNVNVNKWFNFNKYSLNTCALNIHFFWATRVGIKIGDYFLGARMTYLRSVVLHSFDLSLRYVSN